jgi:hypothetical protein
LPTTRADTRATHPASSCWRARSPSTRRSSSRRRAGRLHDRVPGMDRLGRRRDGRTPDALRPHDDPSRASGRRAVAGRGRTPSALELFYDETTRTLYLHTSDDRPPTAHELELVQRGHGIVARGMQYVTVVGFTFRHMQDAGVGFFPGSAHGTVVRTISYGSRQGVPRLRGDGRPRLRVGPLPERELGRVLRGGLEERPRDRPSRATRT